MCIRDRYCPRCGTPLSSHEVAQGYKDVKERSAVAKFAAKGEENAYYLAWTTTPWTLPSNVALCVNPAEEYVKVRDVYKRQQYPRHLAGDGAGVSQAGTADRPAARAVAL